MIDRLTENTLSVLFFGVLLITGLGGIPTAFAASDDPGLTTTEVEATPSAVGANHGGGDHNLKLYGPQQWDIDGDGTTGGDDTDEGDGINWHDGAADETENFGHEDSPYFDTARLEPAYHQAADEDTNTLTATEVEYKPTFWMPTAEAVQPGTTSGIFDVGDSDELDYSYIHDEDVSGINDGNDAEDRMDKLTVDDNIPDFASRNDDTGEGEDIYFPAILQKYTFVKYTSADDIDTASEGDEIAFPMSSDGDQAGLDGYEPVDSAEEVHFDHIDSSGGDAEFRIETEPVDLGVDDTIQFADFQATVKSAQDVDGSPDKIKLKIEWLGPLGSPKTAQSTVTIQEGELATAERQNADTHGADTCDEASKTANVDASDQVWYVCADTVSVSSGGDVQLLSLEVGRVFADRDDTAHAGSLLVDGVFYSVQVDYADALDDDGSIDSFSFEQINPLGENVDIDALGMELKGTPSGSSPPVLPPFDRSHDVVEDFGLDADTDQYQFYELDNEDGADGSDEIDIEEATNEVEERTTSKSALTLTWEAKAQETGLLPHHQETEYATGADCDEDSAPCWRTVHNNVFPSHYVEIDLGEKALVESGLAHALTGMDEFLWTPDGDNNLYFGDSVRLYSEHIDGANGDTLHLNPARITQTDAQAGGDPADPVIDLTLRHRAWNVFNDEDAPDDELDLDAIDDEDDDTAQDYDSESATDNTFDAPDGDDNLFEIGATNTDDSQGDQYGPAVIQEHTYQWLDRGSKSPAAPGLAGNDFDDAAYDDSAADSNTKTRLPVTSPGDGSGLDDTDVDGDGEADPVTIEDYHEGDSVLRVETGETINVGIGDSAQFLDHEVEVRSVPNADEVKVRIRQMDSGDGEEVVSTQTIDTAAGERFFGVTYDYATLESSAGGSPPGGGTLIDPTAADGYDWYVYVDSVTEDDSAELRLGRFLPADDAGGDCGATGQFGCWFIVDQNLYRLASVAVDAAGDDTIQSFTLAHATPIGFEPTVGSDDNVLTSIDTGDDLPLLTPFDDDHTILETQGKAGDGVELEEDQYGFFDPGNKADTDGTSKSVKDRTTEVNALSIGVSALGEKDQSFIWYDSSAQSTTARQQVQGIFDGAGGTGGGPATAGFPDGSFSQPDRADGSVSLDPEHEDSGDIVANGDRGIHQYVALDIPAGHGVNILDSDKITADGTPAPTNVLGWDDTGVGGLSTDGADTDVDARFAFESSDDILDLFLGDGTVPQGQTEDPEDKSTTEAQPVFSIVSFSCSPTSVTQGESTSCSATVKEDGSASGSGTLVYTADGNQFGTRDFQLSAGEEKTLAPVSWSTSSSTSAGDHTLTVTIFDTDKSQSTTVSVSEPAPPDEPDVSVQSCTLSTSQTELGQTVRVTVTFANNGDADGPGAADVQVDGSTVITLDRSGVPAGGTADATGSVTVDSSLADVEEPAPGERNEQTVSITADGANCGDLVVFLETAEDEAPTDGVPGFQAYALITAIVSAAVLARRRL